MSDRDWIDDARAALGDASLEMSTEREVNRAIDALYIVVDGLAAEREKRSKSDDGWIPWSGGKCPVSPDTYVDVMFRNGSIFADTKPGSDQMWKHFNSAYDIVAWRMVHNGTNERDERIAELEQENERLRNLTDSTQDDNKGVAKELADANDKIAELEADNRWMAKKLAELERENERLRKRDVRKYIPHPDEWPKRASFVEIVYNGKYLPKGKTLINVVSHDEARRLHEGDSND